MREVTDLCIFLSVCLFLHELNDEKSSDASLLFLSLSLFFASLSF